MKVEYQGKEDFLQRDSVEHKGYAEVQSTDRREGKERDGASDLLETILNRDNLNRAYKRVRRNHGAAGIDGMTVEKTLPWLKEHRKEQGDQYFRTEEIQISWILLQTKDSQQRDTLVSSTTISPCTDAVEPPCTGRYTRWCERSALYLYESLLLCSGCQQA